MKEAKHIDTGAAVIQRILFLCLREDDMAMLMKLARFPEFVERHIWLADHPNPMPCEWDHFNYTLFGNDDGPYGRQCHLSAYDPAPGFAYHNNPDEHERRQRLIMLFGIPTYKSEYSWGDMLMWTVSFRELSLFSGLTDWVEKQKATT